LKYITLLSLLLLFLPNVYCQTSDDNPKPERTNLEIIEENILTQLQKFLYYPGLNRDYVFVFTVNPMQGGGNVERGELETRFINNIVRKLGESNKLKFSFISNPSEIKLDSNYNLVLLQVYDLQTTYPGFKKNKFLGEKTLTRSIKIKIGIDITSSDRKFSLKDFIYSDYKDEIGYDEYKKLESPPYEFTMARVPDTGIFERIILPIGLIAASAAVIILFFAIRTK
jgi:hypothetical protein